MIITVSVMAASQSPNMTVDSMSMIVSIIPVRTTPHVLTWSDLYAVTVGVSIL